MLIAGPCAIESREQAFTIAEFVKSNGATCFRGGAFKGQNRPIVNGEPEYTGLGHQALEILSDIQDIVKIPCVCDAQSIEQVKDILKFRLAYLMVGARNMDNLCLLRDIRRIYDFNAIYKPPIILKRGPSSTIDEWIGAAEHLGGPSIVTLCERGTVHFDRHDTTRYRLDFVGVAEIKVKYPDYKIIIDPSHGSGNRSLVPLLSKAASYIADGLMIETHFNPYISPTDAAQTVDFETFKSISEYYYGAKANQAGTDTVTIEIAGETSLSSGGFSGDPD